MGEHMGSIMKQKEPDTVSTQILPLGVWILGYNSTALLCDLLQVTFAHWKVRNRIGAKIINSSALGVRRAVEVRASEARWTGA